MTVLDLDADELADIMAIGAACSAAAGIMFAMKNKEEILKLREQMSDEAYRDALVIWDFNRQLLAKLDLASLAGLEIPMITQGGPK